MKVYNAVQTGVYKKNPINSLLSSTQWSTHARSLAFNGNADKKSVIPGGGILDISMGSKGDTELGIRLWQFCLRNEQVETVQADGFTTSLSKAKEIASNYQSEVEDILKGYGLVQWGSEGVQTDLIPSNLSLSGLELYHLHNGLTEKMDISVNASERTVTFATSELSTFVFATNPSNSGGGGSSSPESSKTSDYAGEQGTWIQDETGWWLKKADDSYPADVWIMTGNEWYRFDAKGYMINGWFIDTDGKWYYFNANSDGTKGALLVNATTPDGYMVDAEGVWIP